MVIIKKFRNLLRFLLLALFILCPHVLPLCPIHTIVAIFRFILTRIFQGLFVHGLKISNYIRGAFAILHFKFFGS